MKKRHYSLLCLLSLSCCLGIKAQKTPAEFIGNVKNWSNKSEIATIGQNEGFICHITEIKTNNGIIFNGEEYPDRVKLVNGSDVELPELTELGTISFIVTGGAGASVHQDGSLRTYNIPIEQYKNGTWESVGTIGADMPKAVNAKQYDLKINTSDKIKLRIRNTDQSIWLYGMKVTAVGGNSDNNPDTSNEDGTWQSNLLSMAADGRLTYHRDEDGFILPDFSQAGYKNGQEPTPIVEVGNDRMIVVEAPSGTAQEKQIDQTARIQTAIDQVGNMPLGPDGIRGVVLLKAGRYYMDGTVYLSKDGIILRGEGNKFNKEYTSEMTRLYRRNAQEKELSVVVLGKTGSNWWKDAGNKTGISTFIKTTKVMPGDWSIEVYETDGFNVGDAIYIKYPLTEKWLAALKYGGNSSSSQKWGMGTDINMCYYRYITKIEGKNIYLDAPMFYTLDRELCTGAFINKMNTQDYIVYNVALENMDIEIEKTPTASQSLAQQHCVMMSSCENSWMREVSMSGFIHSGVHTQATTRSTIENCYSVDPSGGVLGGNHYNFDVSQFSQLILFKDCYARSGRHNFISNGCASVSGIVAQNFISEFPGTASEGGHRYWTQGVLFDNWKEKTSKNFGVLGMYLRDNMGTAHGWGGTQCVLWNCDAYTGDILLDKVPTGQNYAIGCKANKIRKYRQNDANYATGYVEGHNKEGLQPASLYEAQKIDFRLKSNPTGISQTESVNKKMNVYVENAHIVFQAQTNGLLHIYNIQGIKLQTIKVSAKDNAYSKLLVPGIYILEFEQDKNTRERCTICIAK